VNEEINEESENEEINEESENEEINEESENEEINEESENEEIKNKKSKNKNFLISRLDYPVSINEKSFCFNPDDDSGRIPKDVLKRWFDNKPELLHDTVKDLLYENGYDDEMKLKSALIQCIKDCGVRYDNSLVYWMNTIIDKSRRYFID
jgi:hypothetical protein